MRAPDIWLMCIISPLFLNFSTPQSEMPFTSQLNISFSSNWFFFWINICHCLLSAVIKVIRCSPRHHRWRAVRGCCWWVTNSFGEGADSHGADRNLHWLLGLPRTGRPPGPLISRRHRCWCWQGSEGSKSPSPSGQCFPIPKYLHSVKFLKNLNFFLVKTSSELPAPPCWPRSVTTSCTPTQPTFSCPCSLSRYSASVFVRYFSSPVQ